ncbi:hypothetical protein F8G81_09495 [Arthrobacter sp. CDRTa11]|uniref:hypothetical protein n=1 Tax=Arthrobacter sp. CDRTa11 TaxID=2651199 RepID=UPI002265E520|nr:hypothetical protein [Arthrobacter sp. CDRTa11]UZX02818.1 hypothetical protein F8G81_09495 [Arthrobacter sp. CDRTa11]
MNGRNREVLRRTDPLTLYRDAFDRGSRHGGSGERTEITIGATPGDQVSDIHVTLRSVPLSTTEAVPLLHIGKAGSASLEITELTSNDPLLTLRVTTDWSGTTISALSPDATVRDFQLSFQLWEICSPLRGASPYLYSVLALQMDVPFAPQRPLLITLRTPVSVGPRSTQGNFTLAYPSRLDSGFRLTNIYFRNSPVRLFYRFAPNEGLTAPWLHLGRAGVASLLIFVVAILATKIDEGDRFSALIAIFIAVAGVIWDFSREISTFSVYNATRSWIQATVLSAQVTVFLLLAAAVVGLTSAPTMLETVGTVSLITASVLVLLSSAALIAHAHGFWQRFVCDHEGCTYVFRWRRARPECHYTGRVHCDAHLLTICGSCPHAIDLTSNSLRTASTYGSADTPCGAVTGGEIR